MKQFDMIIYPANKNESRLIQEILLDLGCRWGKHGYRVFDEDYYSISVQYSKANWFNAIFFFAPYLFKSKNIMQCRDRELGEWLKNRMGGEAHINPYTNKQYNEIYTGTEFIEEYEKIS